MSRSMSSTRPGISGVAIRTFDPGRRLWSIYWVGSDGLLGAPVHGRFEDGVGRFEGEDEHEGRPVKVRFRWTRDGAGPGALGAGLLGR